MTKLLTKAPPNEYIKGISYPQRNLESIFSTLLELKETIELLGGLRKDAIGRAALYEELAVLDIRVDALITRVTTTEADIVDIQADIAAILVTLAGLTYASTTEVLLGSLTNKIVSPNGLAALWEKGGAIAAAATMLLDEGGLFVVTSGGGANIADIDFVVPKDGRRAVLYFSVAATLVHSATLVCPGAINIPIASGDRVEVIQRLDDEMLVLSVVKADGTILSAGLASATEVLTGVNATKAVPPSALAALWGIGANIALAATLTLGEGGLFFVTAGTGPVTDIDFTVTTAGRSAMLIFTTSGTINYSGSNLFIIGGANWAFVAGDRALVYQTNGADQVYLFPFPQSGKAITFQTATETPFTATGDIVSTNVQTAIAELDKEKTPLDGYLFGLTLSNNVSDITNDIDIAIGVAADSTGARYMRRTSSITKRLDAAWAVGTNQGGLDTGAIANTTYHVWLIMRSDTGVVDVLFSTSATAPTMPANYDFKRRIGSIVRVSAAIKPFKQRGNYFWWVTKVQDHSDTADFAYALIALTLPTGIVIQPLLSGDFNNSSGAAFAQLGDATDSGAAGALYLWVANISMQGASNLMGGLFTNTSAQIYYRVEEGTTLTESRLFTQGWIDDRGRSE